MTVRFVIPAVLLLAVACGSKQPAGGGAGTGSDPGTGTTLVKQQAVAFGTSLATGPDVEPPKTRVWLQVTDETGAAQSFPIDTFVGTCSAEPGGEMEALGTLRCWWAGAGVNVIVVLRVNELIVLRQWVEEIAEEPFDYEELSRVTTTYGAKVVFQP